MSTSDDVSKKEDRNDIDSRLIDYHLMEQDLVKVAPKICKVLLENDRVRVLEIRFKPGGKLPMHSHPAYIV
jgi:quercetin dioxygenase-like cupin family protein